MARTRGAHVFVDETKHRDYVMAATSIQPDRVAAARHALRGLLLPGSHRVHFAHERPARRARILDAIACLEVRVSLHVAATRDHTAGRRACLHSILEDVVRSEAALLVIERDDSVERDDRRLLADRLRGLADPPRYQHRTAREEPLLWISDAVAWCAQRDAAWRRRVAPLVVAEHRT